MVPSYLIVAIFAKAGLLYLLLFLLAKHEADCSFTTLAMVMAGAVAIPIIFEFFMIPHVGTTVAAVLAGLLAIPLTLYLVVKHCWLTWQKAAVVVSIFYTAHLICIGGYHSTMFVKNRFFPAAVEVIERPNPIRRMVMEQIAQMEITPEIRERAMQPLVNLQLSVEEQREMAEFLRGMAAAPKMSKEEEKELLSDIGLDEFGVSAEVSEMYHEQMKTIMTSPEVQELLRELLDEVGIIPELQDEVLKQAVETEEIPGAGEKKDKRAPPAPDCI